MASNIQDHPIKTIRIASVYHGCQPDSGARSEPEKLRRRSISWASSIATTAQQKGSQFKRSYFGNGDSNAVSLFAPYHIRGFDVQPT
jgi:hypothetical protein